MIVHYDIDFDDLMALQKDFIENSETHKNKKTKYAWYGAIIVFLVPFIVMTLYAHTITKWGLVIPIFYFILWVLIAKTVYNKRIFAAIKKQFRNKFSYLIGEWKVTFTDDELIHETENSNRKFKWSEFESLSADSTHYFLYTSDSEGLIIKKIQNGLSDDEQQELLSLIRKRFR